MTVADSSRGLLLRNIERSSCTPEAVGGGGAGASFSQRAPYVSSLGRQSGG